MYSIITWIIRPSLIRISRIIHTIVIHTIECFPIESIDFNKWIICRFCLMCTKFSRIFCAIYPGSTILLSQLLEYASRLSINFTFGCRKGKILRNIITFSQEKIYKVQYKHEECLPGINFTQYLSRFNANKYFKNFLQQAVQGCHYFYIVVPKWQMLVPKVKCSLK